MREEHTLCRQVFLWGSMITLVCLMGCHPRPRPTDPSVINQIQEAVSSRWEEVRTLKLFAQVTLSRVDGTHEGYMELSYKAPSYLRADFTHDKDSLVGMVFYVPEKGVKTNWEYYPGQRIIRKTGQPPKPPKQPVQTPYIRKLTGFMRGYADYLTALLTGQLLDTSRLNYTEAQKAGNVYVLTGGKDPGLVAEVEFRKGTAIIRRVQYPKQVLDPNTVMEREGRIVVEYNRFSEKNGILFPMLVTATSVEKGWTLVISYTRVEVNPELDEDVFRKPPWKLPQKRPGSLK